MKDLRSHPKSLPLLRETRMPAVQIEPCFITNPKEAALLAMDDFRREVVRCLADAIERFLGATTERQRLDPGPTTAISAGADETRSR